MQDEKYWQRVQKRHPHLMAVDAERSVRCLCCRDQAILPDDVVRRYVRDDYNTELNSEEPYLCARCDALYINVEIAGKHDDEGQTITKRVPRLAPWAADTSLNAEACQWIHDQERDRLSKPFSAPASVGIADIGRPMPAARPQDLAKPIQTIEAVSVPVETAVSGFAVGDRVVVAIDHLDPFDQKEIVKNDEAPVGAIARVEWLGVSEVAKDLGLDSLSALIRLQDDRQYELPIEFLRRAAA